MYILFGQYAILQNPYYLRAYYHYLFHGLCLLFDVNLFFTHLIFFSTVISLLWRFHSVKPSISCILLSVKFL